MIDEYWRRIVREIPSEHIQDRLCIHAFGFRRELMLLTETKQYLEVGCRLGHSLAAVLVGSPKAKATVVDSWVEDYAGEPNEGPRVVAQHLYNLAINPLRVDFRIGDSDTVLPSLLGFLYDVILVDGDRTPEGARKDLVNCLPLLAPGGIIYFDDYEPPLSGMVQAFAASHDLSILGHTRHGEIPGWCTIRR